MKTIVSLIALSLLLSLAGCSGRDRNVDFAVGQVWSYQNRPADEGSRIHIVRIDQDAELGTVYHIQVDGLSMAHPYADGGVQPVLQHLPVAAATLRASVDKLIKTDPDDLPDISAAYAAWKNGLDLGEAGVFDIPVAEIVQTIEDAVNGRRQLG